MQITDIRCIAVIGAGLMGRGIALDFAAHGYQVCMYARGRARLDEALQNIQNELAMLERLGQLNTEQAAATLPRIRTGTVIQEMAQDADLVIEAVDKWYLYRAVDEHGQIIDVSLREHRDTASAEAFFAQALGRSGQPPSAIVTDHHQPYIKAIQRTVPTAVHIRSGLHRLTGETTKSIERSHVPTRSARHRSAADCMLPNLRATGLLAHSHRHTMSRTPVLELASDSSHAVFESSERTCNCSFRAEMELPVHATSAGVHGRFPVAWNF